MRVIEQKSDEKSDITQCSTCIAKEKKECYEIAFAKKLEYSTLGSRDIKWVLIA